MRVYNIFMLFVATIIFIVLGIGLISVGFDSEILKSEGINSFLQQNVEWVLSAGVILVLLAMLEIFTALKNLNRMPVIAFSNPLGEVRVAYDALEDYIKSLSTEISEIKDAKPQVVAGREGIEIHARLVVERDVNLPELTSRFQDLVSRYVKDVMGIDSVTAIKVYVQRIASRRSRSSQEEDFSEEEAA